MVILSSLFYTPSIQRTYQLIISLTPRFQMFVYNIIIHRTGTYCQLEKCPPVNISGAVLGNQLDSPYLGIVQMLQLACQSYEQIYRSTFPWLSSWEGFSSKIWEFFTATSCSSMSNWSQIWGFLSNSKYVESASLSIEWLDRKCVLPSEYWICHLNINKCLFL